MQRQPLNKSVSIQELMHMRDVEHLSNSEIARRLDVNPSTIFRYIGPADPSCRAKGKNNGRPLTQELIDQIRELYQAGRSVNGISEKLGIGWATVKKYTCGISRPGKKQPEEPFRFDPPEEVMAELHEEDSTMLEIISQKRTVHLKGSECRYEVETDGEKGTLTIINGETEVIMFDRASLGTFIKELENIRDEYLREVV